MIIDFNYILKRIDFLINENRQNLNENASSSKTKSTALKWAKRILSSFYGDFKLYYIGIQQIKHSKKEIQIPPLNLIALSFMKYFFVENRNFSFDTSLYFDESQNKDIMNFFDNRIRSTVAGLGSIKKTVVQEENLQIEKFINGKVQKDSAGFFHLKLHDENEYILPIKYFAPDVFVRHYGLKELSDELKNYITGKDFLDLGAFYGDTCLIFSNYKPRRIYAYEPVKSTFDLMIETLHKNNIDIVVPINKGVGEEKDIITIFSNDSDAAASSIVYNQGSNSQDKISEEQIEIVTIDEECKDRKVGLIKMDVEGYEYYAIKGGIKTIQRDKPILLISIYHTAKDFFEIPPMIRSVCPDYLFRYMDISPSTPITDKIILAYPSVL